MVLGIAGRVQVSLEMNGVRPMDDDGDGGAATGPATKRPKLEPVVTDRLDPPAVGAQTVSWNHKIVYNSYQYGM